MQSLDGPELETLILSQLRQFLPSFHQDSYHPQAISPLHSLPLRPLSLPRNTPMHPFPSPNLRPLQLVNHFIPLS